MTILAEYLKNGFDGPRDIIAQLIGLVPLALSIFIFAQKSRKRIIFLKGCSDFLWAVHFFILGEFSGGAINAVNTVRSIVFAQREKKWAQHILIPVAFCIFTVLCAVPGFQGFYSLLPITGSVLAIIGFWQNNVKLLRIFNLFGVTLWLIYGLWIVSVPTIASNIFSICSILTGLFREKRAEKTA